MELLNQPVKIVPNADDTEFSLFNTINGQELARIKSNEPMELWVNKGGFMTKEEYDKARNREVIHQMNAEMIGLEI